MAKPAKNSGAWITTFADLMALLLTFFVLIMTFSTLEVEKYRGMVDSFETGFRGMGIGLGRGILPGDAGVLEGKEVVAIAPLPVPRPETAQIGEAIDEALAGFQLSSYPPEQVELYRQCYYALVALIEAGTISLSLKDVGVTVRFDGRASFPKGDAELSAWLADTLGVVGAVLEKTTVPIIVSGHTDDQAIQDGSFRSKWDLSAARAASVLRYLVSAADIEPARIVAQGRADSDPLLPNTNPLNRAKNRRVEITLTESGDR